jgi:hypothetical protein
MICLGSKGPQVASQQLVSSKRISLTGAIGKQSKGKLESTWAVSHGAY